MSTSHRNTGKNSGIPVAEVQIDESDTRRNGTFTRIRTAILQEQFAAFGHSDESSGSDPYNSGVHRSLEKKPHSWGKRSR